MTAKWKLAVVVLVLVLAGGGVASYKSAVLGVPFWKGREVYEWQVEAKVSFVATGRRVKARLALPAAAVANPADREAGSLGYHYHLEDRRGRHVAVWSAENREDAQALYFRSRFPDRALGGAEAVPADGAEAAAPALAGTLGTAAQSVVDRLKAVSADPDSLVVALFDEIRLGGPSQESVLVKRHYEKETKNHPLVVMGIDLLEIAGVPARLAYGVRLEEDRGAQPPVPLVEYWDGASWQLRDPAEPAVVPDGRTLLVWHRGGGPLLDVTGGENSRVVFTVSKDRIPLAILTDLRESPLLVSTILGLPLSERAVFRYIVLIPLGAFVVVLLRNLVGVPTLGTFMPVLIALALLEMPLGRGLLMFAILIAAGLWCRFLLSRLNLLVVPRVAACVVIVTLLMMLMSVVGHRLEWKGGSQITVFPMIILAWTIERMSIIWEEEGKRNALVQVGGSLAVAVLAYLFMRIGQVRYWAFYFPELLLVLLAGILLVGRYTGYRLSELVRFRRFATPEPDAP